MTAPPSRVPSVSELTGYLRELLASDENLNDIWVEGQISNLSQSSAGHIYFTLRDRQTALRCAFFRNRQTSQDSGLLDGVSLIVHGSLSIYEQRGDLSFIVDFVQPEGTGALAAEFERRRANLEAEGMFDVKRKRSLPRFPERIGIVTSPTGAVLHDIITILGRRWPLATLFLQPTVVQGERAPHALSESLRALGTLPADSAPDVIIIGRGGGSAEELWAFNEESVVRAIFASQVPVVSAVGHETDTTLSDLVADVRAPTPSAAAELVAPDRTEVQRSLTTLRTRFDMPAIRLVMESRQRLGKSAVQMHRSMPMTTSRRDRVRDFVSEMHRCTEVVTASARERNAEVRGRLTVLSPLATLKRGYAVVERITGDPIGSAASLNTGDRVQMRLRDGIRLARIEEDQSE